MKYYIRRKSDGQLVAIRYQGEHEAKEIVNYLNQVDKNDEYYYEYR
jgi:hypothetical protein